MEQYALENGISYYNFVDKIEEIGIDFSQDTYDAGLHLNLTGATKMSKYFAEILMQNYDLTNYRGDTLYEEKLQEYKEFIQ